jgi:hypothetical protein
MGATPRASRLSEALNLPTPATPPELAPAQSASTPSTGLRRVAPSRDSLKTPPKDIIEQYRRQSRGPESSGGLAVDLQTDHSSLVPVERTAEASQDETDMSVTVRQDALTQRPKATVPAVKNASMTIPLSFLLLALLKLLSSYKSQSSALGYCDPNSMTNDIILRRENALQEAQACVARNTRLKLENGNLDQLGSNSAVTLYDCDVSSLPLIPFLPRPQSCTPCPPHAICSQGLMTCSDEYILTPHPLSFVSGAIDGLPLVGPKALPSYCRPDTEKKRMVGSLARELEGDLAKTRGEKVCSGVKQGDVEGVEEGELREWYGGRKDVSGQMFGRGADVSLNSRWTSST